MVTLAPASIDKLKVTVSKQTEDSDSFIARLYKSRSQLDKGLKFATKDNRLVFNIKAFEIKTFRLKL